MPSCDRPRRSRRRNIVRDAETEATFPTEITSVTRFLPINSAVPTNPFRDSVQRTRLLAAWIFNARSYLKGPRDKNIKVIMKNPNKRKVQPIDKFHTLQIYSRAPIKSSPGRKDKKPKDANDEPTWRCQQNP